MRKRVCIGDLELPNKKIIHNARCVIMRKNPIKWLETRAELILPLNAGAFVGSTEKVMWIVGTFTCKRKDHKHNDDNEYLLKTSEIAKIVKFSNEEYENIVLAVRAIKIPMNRQTEEKPNINRDL